MFLVSSELNICVLWDLACLPHCITLGLTPLTLQHLNNAASLFSCPLHESSAGEATKCVPSVELMVLSCRNPEDCASLYIAVDDSVSQLTYIYM